MSRKRHKPYDQMNTDELGEATREFDRPMPGLPGKPLTAAQKAIHRRAKKMGRPKVGQGVKVISLSVELGLLNRTDALAKRRQMSRAQLVSRALEAELSRAKAG
jgi:hypothetical protein